ncbi:acylamino-acid-releasing enzyme-like [Montipora foliosa]|uniref:acylamino-acid-releasing enzyme-like n=1 Tax=Montipora foliosa TaxID=591990 RepID=UPI0035F18283
MEAEFGSEVFVDKAVAVYREFAKTGSVVNAKVSFLSQDNDKSGSAELSIVSSWSQRDLERNENRTFQRSHVTSYDATTKSFTNIRELSFPVEVQNLQLCTVSATGKIQAIIRNVPGSKGQEDKQFLEIWSTSHLLKSIDVQVCEKHGKIYEDFQFGCLAWSSSEQFLLYVAEKKLPKAVSYFERQKTDAPSDKPAPKKGAQFDFKDDWGEQLVSKSCPVLVIYDVITDEIRVLDNVPDYLSAGQACWGPDDRIVFVGWFHEPYRLGLIYCPMRKNALYSLSLDGNTLEQLSDIKYAVHSPRFNHSKDKLIYFAQDVGGTHNKCGRLMQYDWKTKSTSTIVDVVDIPERGGFPGIYVPRLFSDRNWTEDGKSLAFTTAWRSYQKIILVNCNNKSVKVLTTTPGCWTLLDVNKNIVLAQFSTPNSAPKLMIAVLSDDVPDGGLSWTPVAQTTDDSLEKEIVWEVMSFSRDESSDFQDEYEAIFLRPVVTDEKKLPLIVFPHGGPHVNFKSEFFLPIVCLCKLGFAVLCVNFRGSVGFGQASVNSLPGKVGTQDVRDVQYAANKVLENSSELDSSNVFVTGGSHGGFLTAHLIGQFPGFYRAAAMRNPALNIAVMTEISDIPDWCHCEGGYEFTHDSTPTPLMMSEMLEKSPFVYISQVKTPTLIFLGADDIRVPPSQGKNFYRILKAQGVETRLLWYPGNNHPIAKVDAESDVFVNMARWFFEHLQK